MATAGGRTAPASRTDGRVNKVRVHSQGKTSLPQQRRASSATWPRRWTLRSSCPVEQAGQWGRRGGIVRSLESSDSWGQREKGPRQRRAEGGNWCGDGVSVGGSGGGRWRRRSTELRHETQPRLAEQGDTGGGGSVSICLEPTLPVLCREAPALDTSLTGTAPRAPRTGQARASGQASSLEGPKH